MAKRTPAFERVHVNIELLGVYFPRISQNPSLLDVRAWENLSEENKKGFPVDVSRLLEEPKNPWNTYSNLMRLREQLEEGECSPAYFINSHLEKLDQSEDARPGLGRAPQVRKHMEYLLATADEPLRAELIADGWGRKRLDQERIDRLKTALSQERLLRDKAQS